MPTIAPPAPAKAAAPSAPETPSKPTNGAPPAPEPKISNHQFDSMRELEEMEVPEDRPAPKLKETKVEKEEVTTDDEEAKVEDKAKPATKETEAPKPPKAAELRTAYEKSKETIKAKDAEITRLQSELKSAKDKPADDPEKKAILEKFEASEKRRKELEDEIRFVSFKKSEKFQKEFAKPYMDQWKSAVEEITQLKIKTGEDPQTGEVISRPATAKDLLSLAQLPLDEMDERVETAFGKSAPRVIRQIEKLRELGNAQAKAEEQAVQDAELHEKEQQTQSLQQRQKIATLWQDENKAWQEKFPRWFKPEDGDEEGNTLLAKGYEMADAAFSNNGDKSPEEKVKLHAELRNKAAAFPKLALRLKQAKTRIKELEKSLKEFEQSEPPSTDGGKSRIKTQAGDPLFDSMAELDEIGKK